MNDTEDKSKYSDGNSHYRSPILAGRTATDESFIEKSPKKDKKWSLGGLFRRKKKDADSESSSEEETSQKRGFLQRRRHKKDDKRKRKTNKTIGTFDHVVLPSNIGTNGSKVVRDYEDIDGILSDPILRIGDQDYPKVTPYGSNELFSRCSRESLNKNRLEISNSRSSLQSSLDSQGKRSRREKVKARVEALRDQLKNESSSDEGSQQSNASSANKFRSDESLSKSQNGSISRKSRSARTDRYIKRLTKEEEHVLNKEAEMEQQRVENRVAHNRWVVIDEAPAKMNSSLNYSPSAPLSQKLSGTSTIPPSHSIHRVYSNLSDNQRNHYANQNPYQNITKRPDSQNQIRNHIYQNPKSDYLSDHRSYSYDCNINRSPTPQEGEILHVQFPIGKPVPKPRNPSMINQYSSNQSLQRSPPPPPPRDPQRKVFPNYQYDSNNRPMSYAFENGNQRRSSIGQTPITDKIPRINSYQYNQNINRSSSFGWQPNHRSNSEDYIAQANYVNVQTRPASATPDMQQQRFIKRHPKPEHYQYFADKTPRSRKPIHITTPTTQSDQPYLSDSQMLARAAVVKPPGNSASEFWKQKDLEETRRKSQMLEGQIKKSEHEIQNKNFSIMSIPVKNEVVRTSSHSDLNPRYPKQVFESNIETVKPLPNEIKATIKRELPLPQLSSSRPTSGSSVEQNWNQDEVERKRRSTNLEEALDELEAIYKSLRLGDEDLMDRAERRDVPAAAQKRLNQELFTKWNNPKEVQSDSGFSYDVDTVDGLLPKRRDFKKAPNKLNDDMAYRRLCRDRTTPSVSPVPQSSYLLASPLLGELADDCAENIENSNEPDITLDDVVYRNFKHANNSLKVLEHQPPFGIPIGPITAAPNSDYLHAVPETHHRSRFVPQKSPDVVKDDLAYRSLRKDNSKDPSLPHLGPEDYINNNNPKDYEPTKKKRAVRSMSANIFNIMHRNYTDDENEFDKTQSLTDIADAMEIAHKILREHNSKMFSKMTVSDTETRSTKPNYSFNNTPTSTETLTESKSNLDNNETNNVQQKLRVFIPLSPEEASLNQKPPVCRTPDKKSRSTTKESTPIRMSPNLDDNSLDKSQLEELLTALAIEARETSERLGNDLRMLDEDTKKCTPLATTPNSREDKTSEKLKDIDAVSEHAKLCEKLLECVVESTELIAPKLPEVYIGKDVDLTEEVNDLPLEPSIYKSVANIIVTRRADVPEPSEPRPEVYSDQDYDNISHDRIRMKQPHEELTIEESDIKEDLVETTMEPTPKCISVTSCCKPAQEDCCKEGNLRTECFCTNSECLNEQNLTLLNPSFDNMLTNYEDSTKRDYEHSSGFHSDSNGSSPDFSLENVELRTDFKINFNNEICTHVSNSNNLEYVVDFSSISSSVYKDVLEQEIESEYSSFINLDDPSIQNDANPISYGNDNKSTRGSDNLDPCASLRLTIEAKGRRKSSEIQNLNIDSELFVEHNTDDCDKSFETKFLLVNKENLDICLPSRQSFDNNLGLHNYLEGQPLNSEINFAENSYENIQKSDEHNIRLDKSFIYGDTNSEGTYYKNEDNPLSDTDKKPTNLSLDNTFNNDTIEISEADKSKTLATPLSTESIRISEKLNNPSTSFYISDSSLNNSTEEEDSDRSNEGPKCSEVTNVDKDIAWYHNPTNLVLACTYAIACAHQLAFLDVVTLLGLILAIVTVIAAFVL